MNLEELLAELAKLDRNAVVAGLQTHTQSIFQAIFDKGHGAATAQATARESALSGDVARLTKERDTATTDLKKRDEQQPDLAKVRQQYEEQIRQTDEKHKTAIKAKDAQLLGERQARAVSDLRSKLAGHVDADYADVIVDKPTTKNRIRVLENGTVEVLQEGSEIPFVPGAGKTGLDLLAAELKAATPLKFQTSATDSGSGTSSASGTGKGSGSSWDAITAKAKAEQEAKKTKGGTAAERLHMKVG